MGKFLLKRKEVVVVRKGEAVSYLEEEVQDQPVILSNLEEEKYLANLGGAIVICNGFLHSQDVVDCLLQNFHLSTIKVESSAHQQQINHIESNHNEKLKLTKTIEY